jgi:ABC-type Na+ efflux pump permease subunit
LVLLFRFSTFTAPPYPDYVDVHSYDPATHALTIYRPQDPNGSQTLAIHSTYDASPTSITLGKDNKEIAIEELRGHLAVSADVYRNANKVPIAWAAIHAYEIPRRMSAPEVRQFLLGATIIELAVILLIVTNAAASTVTREKEDGTLDLLLSTPITSRYYIWGKLRGLVSFVLPLIAVPVLSVLFFIVYDLCRLFTNLDDPAFQFIVFPEAVLIMPAMLIIVAAFAAILGMQMSLRCRTTVMAVMLSVGIVVGLCGAMGWCGYKLLQDSGGGPFGVIVGAFSPFTLLTMLIDPYSFAARAFGLDASGEGTQTSARILSLVFSFIAVGAYTAIVWSMYKSMVKNFDMTIRKQSR